MSQPPAGASIVGVYEYPDRVASEHTALQIQGECARQALADAGLEPHDIDGIATAGDSHAAIYVAEYLGLHPQWVDSTTIGGSSFLSHVLHARDALERRTANAVLITYGSTARSSRAAFGSVGRGHAELDPHGVDDSEAFLTPYGVPLIAQYALVASRYMHDYDIAPEQLARVATTARHYASQNSRARYRDPITIDDVLSSRMIASPLHILDCCVITDGGGAVIVANREVAKGCRTQPVHVLGGAEAIAHDNGGHRHPLDLAAKQAGPLAFARTGLEHQDIDLCMMYDSFTITVLTALEALGFCGPGEAGEFVDSGALEPDGSLPLNPDGGALSNNHPGRRGIFLLVEAVKQLRREASGVQIADPKIALCHGTGGYLSGRHSAVTVALGV